MMEYDLPPVSCSQGGFAYNGAHIEYWKARALAAESSAPAQQKLEPVTDEMVDRAMSRFQDAVNSMVSCPRCNGVGYHHGFGEGGHDPDWCSTCGGCQSVAEFDDKAAMREALTAALAFPSTERGPAT